jgi:prepilin-type N-terminal cleavage/methylation domain-containing protein
MKLVFHLSKKLTPRRYRIAKGFSLVELLTAVAVTSMMMVALFSIVGQSSTNYRLSQRKVNTLADSRALFHFLENDLASRVADTKFFLQTNPANHSEFAFIRTRDAQESNATGDLSASLYYVAFTNDDANNSSPKLYRRKLDGVATQKLLEAGNAATFPTYDPTTDDPIAYNIVRFEVIAQERDPAGIWKPWNNALGTAPQVLDIAIELIDDFTAQRFTQESQWLSLAQSTDPKQRETVRRHVHRITLSP